MTRRGAGRFSFSEANRAAYLAGAGATAEEIAAALGNGATSRSVYSLLARLGIRLVPKTRAQTSFPLVLSRESMSAVERLAAARGADPQWLAARMIEAAVDDRRLAGEIIAKVERP